LDTRIFLLLVCCLYHCFALFNKASAAAAACRLETLDRQLQDRKTSFTSFDADVKECLTWLTRIEVALTHYEEMAVADLSTNEDQQNKSQRTFNVCI